MDLNLHKRMGDLLKEGIEILKQEQAVRRIYTREGRPKVGHKLRRSIEALERARCLLDDILAVEYPPNKLPDQEFFKVYYRGGNLPKT